MLSQTWPAGGNKVLKSQWPINSQCMWSKEIPIHTTKGGSLLSCQHCYHNQSSTQRQMVKDWWRLRNFGEQNRRRWTEGGRLMKKPWWKQTDEENLGTHLPLISASLCVLWCVCLCVCICVCADLGSSSVWTLRPASLSALQEAEEIGNTFIRGGSHSSELSPRKPKKHQF